MFVRVDHLRGSSELSYEGPFPIITKLSDFIYRINYKGHSEEINTDRLKPVLMEEKAPILEDSPPSIHQPQSSGSGIEYGKKG